jgi:hypothetical protein|tara:strand:+ start:216 stop:614 length:399 start_codon:yes stop_codon:yes gene_type:complete
MLYDTNVKILSDVDMNNELENLVIKKSSEIGQLQNKIEEQSLLIDDLRKLLEKVIYEKFDIVPSDKILKKMNDIFEKNLKRGVDPEGLLVFYPQIKNKTMDYADFEKIIQESIEFKLLQKKSEKDSKIKFGF